MVFNKLFFNNKRGLSVANAALASFCFLLSTGCTTEVDKGCLLAIKSRTADAMPILSYDSSGRLVPVDTIFPSDSLHALNPGLLNSLLAVAVNQTLLFFIAEQGSIDIDCQSLTANGTPLNEAKREFEETVNKMRLAASEKYDSITTNAALTSDDRKAELAQLSKRETKRIVDYAVNVVKQNGDNALGQYAFLFGIAKNRLVKADDYGKLVTATTPHVANFPPIKIISEANSNAIATSAGCRFRDADLIAPDGSPAKLSNFVHEDAVNIFHIFDPYNPATPQTLALLKKIKSHVNAYHAQHGLSPDVNIISLCEYAGEDIVNKIIGRFAIDWPMLADPNSKFASLYGVQTMPFFIIVCADSKIEERGVGEDALYNWVYTRVSVK